MCEKGAFERPQRVGQLRFGGDAGRNCGGILNPKPSS
jgi:hypothetical protein